jgi:L-threonylcarbamoyladenylate synthase
MQTVQLNPDQLDRAAGWLKEGKLVAFPTETVYGLGACLFLEQAILNIFKVKGRPADNPLIVHVSSLEQVEQIAQDITQIFYPLAEHFFPGPLTVVLKRRSTVPSIVSAGLATVAVRMPLHPIARQLISLVGTPLVAPSANLSGKPSSTCAEHVLEDFDGKIAAIVDGGPAEIGIESTVLSLVEEVPILLRPGAISPSQLEAVLKCPITTAPLNPSGPVASPGMKYRHYAPKTPIKLLDSFTALQSYLDNCKNKHLMLLTQDPMPLHTSNIERFPLSAKELYACLRLADKHKYDEILIFCDAKTQNNGGLMNRILRASSNT